MMFLQWDLVPMINRRSFLTKCGASYTAQMLVADAVAADSASAPIWDLHCHLSGFDGNTPEEKMAQMILSADRLGIDRLCTFMGYPHLENRSEEHTSELQSRPHLVCR